jgi:hypothetical protein
LSKIEATVMKKIDGRVDEGIMAVRFTYRGHIIRIFGAGYWRKGRKIYEDQD